MFIYAAWRYLQRGGIRQCFNSLFCWLVKQDEQVENLPSSNVEDFNGLGCLGYLYFGFVPLFRIAPRNAQVLLISVIVPGSAKNTTLCQE